MSAYEFDPESVSKTQDRLTKSLNHLQDVVEGPLHRVTYPEMPAAVTGQVRSGVAEAITTISTARASLTAVALEMRKKAKELDSKKSSVGIPEAWFDTLDTFAGGYGVSRIPNNLQTIRATREVAWLNQAAHGDLNILGISRSTARLIDEYRLKHGPFKNIKDLDKALYGQAGKREKLKAARTAIAGVIDAQNARWFSSVYKLLDTIRDSRVVGALRTHAMANLASGLFHKTTSLMSRPGVKVIQLKSTSMGTKAMRVSGKASRLGGPLAKVLIVPSVIADTHTLATSDDTSDKVASGASLVGTAATVGGMALAGTGVAIAGVAVSPVLIIGGAVVATGTAVYWASPYIADGGKWVARGAGDLAGDAYGGAKDVARGAGNLAGVAYGGAKDVAGGAGNLAGDAYGGAKDVASDGGKAAKHAGSWAWGKVRHGF